MNRIDIKIHFCFVFEKTKTTTTKKKHLKLRHSFTSLISDLNPRECGRDDSYYCWALISAYSHTLTDDVSCLLKIQPISSYVLYRNVLFLKLFTTFLLQSSRM